ncbi:hypothetical protein RsTz2092_11080 [Deferribacterales bacterium RsTz2092]|nr:hypothetical protein AGMMS49941_09330 [Deferribacterales bacterium]
MSAKLTLFYTAVIIVLVCYMVFGNNGILKYARMTETHRKYEARIAEMTDRIAYLERELELATTNNEYLEYVIRRELGLQKSDEHQYIKKRE